MLSSLKAKLIVAAIAFVIVGFITYRIADWRNEAAKVPGLEAQLKQAKIDYEALRVQCQESKQPAIEANQYDYTKLNTSLTSCLNQLRKSTTYCVPVHSARPTNGVEAAGGQSPSGITESAIIANNIECQADRDALNSAKIWAIGYEKYKANMEKK